MIVLSFAFFCTACTNTANLQRPTAALRDVKLGEVNGQGFTMNFAVDVNNPNSVKLPVSAANYKLAFGGVQVVDGKAKPDEAIPANGSSTVNVPVHLNFEDLLKAKQAIVASRGDVPFSFDGSMDFGGGLASMFGQDVRVPLQYSGTVPLRSLLNNPQVLLNSPAARELATWGLGQMMGK
jgi:LEA14-like dessication related protein